MSLTFERVILLYSISAQVEVEMEADEKPVAVVDGETGTPQNMVSVLDEDEVVLYWNESKSWKFIRELASEDADENKEVVAYYRWVHSPHLYR